MWFYKGSFKYYVITYRGRGVKVLTLITIFLGRGEPDKVLQYYNRGGVVQISIKCFGFRIRRYEVFLYQIENLFNLKDLTSFAFMSF